MHNAATLKRLLLLFTVLLLLLTSIGYLYYNRWQQRIHPATPPPCILAHSALVCSFKAAGQDWEKLQKTTIGQDLKGVLFFEQMQATWTWFTQAGISRDLLDRLPLFVSIHDLDETDTACVFYFDTSGVSKKQILPILERLDHQTCQLHEKQYSGQTILAVSQQIGATIQKYYILQQKNYMIASTAHRLIEEIAQGLSTNNTRAFLPIQPPACKGPAIFINFVNIPAFMQKILNPAYSSEAGLPLMHLAPWVQLESKLTTHCLLLTGTLPSGLGHSAIQQPDWIDAVAQAPPTLLTPADYIPAQSAVVQYYTFQNPILLGQQLKGYLTNQRNHPPIPTVDDALTASEKALNQLLSHDMAHCTVGPTLKDAIVLLRVENPETALVTLQEVGLVTAHLSGDRKGMYTVDAERFKGWLPNLAFPHFLPQVLTLVDDYLVLATSVNTLSQVHRAYTRGYTWAMEGTAPHLFLASTVAAANFSLVVNLRQAWPLLMPLLQPSWQTWCEEHLQALHQSGYVGVQCMHMAQIGQKKPSYGLNILLSHVTGHTKAAPEEEGPLSQSTYFQTRAPIITQPFFVKTHKTNALYVLVQDAEYKLYFVDNRGNLIWEKQLEGPIRTDLFTIDYYNNNKLQYLFSTAEATHLIDYMGKEVAIYPQKLPRASERVRMNVVDYEGNKKYRFLIADDERGHIYLKNTQYASLPGWNPMALQGAFTMTPFHFCIKKDYFVSIQENGLLYLFNRKGKIQPHFPVTLHTTLHNPLVLQPASQLATSQVILLTDDGHLLFYNLLGVCMKQVVLPKTAETINFTLARDTHNPQRYALFRQDADTLAVLDGQGKLLFEKSYTSETTLRCQYYSFGERALYCMTDSTKQVTYIYNQQGVLLHDSPLDNSGQGVQLFFTAATQQLTVYTSFENTIRRYQLSLANQG